MTGKRPPAGWLARYRRPASRCASSSQALTALSVCSRAGTPFGKRARSSASRLTPAVRCVLLPRRPLVLEAELALLELRLRLLRLPVGRWLPLFLPTTPCERR